MKKKAFYSTSCCFLLLICLSLNAQTGSGNAEDQYGSVSDVFYYAGEAEAADAYMQERCRLDLYYPAEKKEFATVVWFHGGALKAGNRYIPDGFRNQGIAVAAVNYRLYPKVKAPVYLKDAAAAVAWIFKHIEDYGGSSELIFVSGHSAGGYLTSMIGLDKQWLAPYDIDANRIAGLIPFSGHTITHMTVREERGIPGEQPIVDEMAPLYYVRPDAPPLILITGDRNEELLGRYEENAYLWRMMQVAGHQLTDLYEIQGFDHGGMVKPACSILLDYVEAISEKRR